jgi:hypothetical protein
MIHTGFTFSTVYLGPSAPGAHLDGTSTMAPSPEWFNDQKSELTRAIRPTSNGPAHNALRLLCLEDRLSHYMGTCPDFGKKETCRPVTIAEILPPAAPLHLFTRALQDLFVLARFADRAGFKAHDLPFAVPIAHIYPRKTVGAH